MELQKFKKEKSHTETQGVGRVQTELDNLVLTSKIEEYEYN